MTGEDLATSVDCGFVKFLGKSDRVPRIATTLVRVYNMLEEKFGGENLQEVLRGDSFGYNLKGSMVGAVVPSMTGVYWSIDLSGRSNMPAFA